MAVSGYLSAELAATCNALGFYDGQKYHLEPHCKETIRDLIRYLRRDEGGSHEIRRYLGNAKLLQTDLLPMVQYHHQDAQLFDIALRLIVNLTNPALLVYNEVIPTDKFEHNYYLEIVSHLQLYKEAFNDHRAWAPFTERLSVLLGKPVEDRSEDDQRTVERILILIRNVLHVPSSADHDQRPDNDASVHDQVLWGLHQSGMLDLLLYISSSDQEKMFFMHLLEILCLMLREQPPELLAKTASQRSAEEKNKDDEALLKIRHAELQAKMQKHKKYFGTRHSNFGGTYVIKNLKSTSDNNDLIYHKPVHDSKYISLDTEKKPVKLPRNRRPLKCESVERKSALSVRLILKQVCVEFLNAAYNPLMLHVRECFHRGRAQENDESYYFTAMRFFMEFNRHYNFQVKYVSETLSVQTFQFIQKFLEQWHEMMVTDKKKLPLWSYRSHLALRAYKELLHNLAFMDRSSDESVRESSKVIKSNIFYVVEYREMLLTLVNMYKREKYSRKYLIDLVETIHIFTKLLCDFGKDKKMVIQKTATRRKKKSKNNKTKSTQDQASAETIWNLACDDVALTLSSPVGLDVVPFDATLDLDMDQQKLEAIKKIQFHLKNGDYKQAVALLRASREVWPENDTFGSSTADAAEELDMLKDIFLADLGTGAAAAAPFMENGSDVEGSEEEDNYSLILEKNFEVIDFVKRFANPKVVKICNNLLSTYDTNSETTNHCIVKLLYRIAFECKLPAMLFQASLFIKFRNILANYEPKHKELAKLAVYITRKFTEVAATNQTVFVELLFPKHVKDACEIVDGYGSYQDSKNKRIAWEEHEEEELRRLDEEYRATNVKEDKVDWILENLINKERSKRGVVKKMKELGLEVPETKKPKGAWEEEEEEEVKRLYEECDKDMPEKLIVSFIHERMTSKNHSERSIKKKMYELNLLQKPIVSPFSQQKLKIWTEDQDEDLTELFNLHKHDDDVMRPIMAVLGNLRSRQNVVGALLRLGLIADKDEVRRKPKSRKSKQADSDDEDSDDESDDGEENARSREDRPPLVGPSAAALHSEMSRSKYILGGLKWLISAMNDNLEDLDAEVFDADVPLLPLSEDPVLSMENPAFKDFLHAIGFKKPVQHQEVYWRVSSTWKETDFRTRIDVFNFIFENHEQSLDELASDLNQKLSTAVGEDVDVLRTTALVQDDNDSDPGSSSIQKYKKRDLKKTTQKKSNLDRLQNFSKENGDDRSGAESVDEDDDAANSHWSLRKRLSSDSEEEDPRSRPGSSNVPMNSRSDRMLPGQNSEDEDDPGVGERSATIRRNSGRIQDDSDDEASRVSTKRKLTSSDDSGSEAPRSNKKRNLLDSDDEMENEVPVGSSNSAGGIPAKKRSMIHSDDENNVQGSKYLTNNTPGTSAGKTDEETRSSRKKRKVIDSDDDMDSQTPIGTNVSNGHNGGVDSDDEMDNHVPINSELPVTANGEVGNSAGSPAVKHSKPLGARRKPSRIIDSDDDTDSQVSVASKSSNNDSHASAVDTLTPRKVAKKKSRVIDSDDEMDGQISSKYPRDHSEASKKPKEFESGDEKGQASATSKSSVNRAKVAKKSKAIDSDDEMEAQASAASKSSGKRGKGSNKSEALGSDEDMDSQSTVTKKAKVSNTSLLKEKKRKQTLDSEDELESITDGVLVNVSKANRDLNVYKKKRISPAVDSEDDESASNSANGALNHKRVPGILDSEDDEDDG